MRILILATDIYTRGGIARQTYTLASALADLAESVEVLALLAYGDPGDVRPRFRVWGPMGAQPTRAAKLLFAGKALALARRHYDLTVCSTPASAPVAAALRAVYGTPYWVVCHGTEVWGPLPWLKRLALRHAALLLPVSRFTAEKLATVHGMTRLAILHNAIPQEFERLLTAPAGAAGAEGEAVPGERLLLSVGSLTRAHAYKGFDTVLRALPLARQRVPNLRYVIVGEGDDRARLENLARELGLENCVTFARSVSNAQLAEYYRACDALVLPSKTARRAGAWEGEGFGRVYVEAALAGKPVVGSRQGGAAEAVLDGQTGLLVDPTSVEETARAITALLENPTAATQMGQQGREWARERFTEEALRRELGGLLKEGVRCGEEVSGARGAVAVSDRPIGRSASQ
jgi:glycosyltransferase involved in cell wall biosynthesis